jgi:asparagine synthase (glutamine-hydrolysing)
MSLRRALAAVGGPPVLSPLALRVRDEGLTYLSKSKLLRIEDAMREVQRTRVPGGFAEFGVALGGSTVLLARQAMAQARPFHGFDVFATIPEPTSDKDDAASRDRYKVIASGQSEGIAGETYYGYLDDLYERVSATLTRHGAAPTPGSVMLHKGLFEQTVPRVQLAPLAFAHIDCDWYDPVRFCLDATDAALAPGGVVVIDDYHDYGGCRTATDEFLAHHPAYEFRDGPNPILVKGAARG